MTIRPITSVSFKSNYNKLTFEGRKDKQNNHRPSYVSNTIKSIPLAAIIAMSPLNTSLNVSAQEPVQKELVMSGRVRNATPPDAVGKYGECDIDFISTDGNNNNAEIIQLMFFDPQKGEEFINGVRTECEYTYTTTMELKALERCKEIRKYDGAPDKLSERYFVAGPGSYARSYFYDLDGNCYNTGNFDRKGTQKQEVTKEFYDYLANLLKDADMVEYKTTTKTIDGDEETDQFLDALTGGSFY